MNTEKTDKPKFYKRPGVRILAFLLAVLMVFNIWLGAMISMRQFDEQYIGQFLELARKETLNSTEYLKENDFARARRILRHSIGKPDSFEDFETLASVAIAHGDYDEAVGYMQGCIDLFDGSDADCAVLYLRKGSLQMLSGESEYAEAKKSFSSAVTLDPSLADAWLLRAQLNLLDGDTEAAVRDVTEYKTYGKDTEILAAIAPLYEAAGDYESAIECYTAALDNSKGEAAEALKSRGSCYLQLFDTEKALADFEAYLTSGGSDSDGTVHLLIALCRLEQERYPDVLGPFDIALSRGCDASEVFPQMIACAYACGEYEKVCSYVDRALELKKIYTETEIARFHLWKGLSCLALDDPSASAEEMEKAISADSTLPDIFYYAGIAYLSLENFEKTAEFLTKSIERDEETETCMYNRGIALANLGEYEKAIEDFNWIINNASNDDYISSAKEFILVVKESIQ